jgi:hypothetical protein
MAFALCDFQMQAVPGMIDRTIDRMSDLQSPRKTPDHSDNRPRGNPFFAVLQVIAGL